MNPKGLTLIEVLVAAVVLLVGTSSLLFLFNSLGGHRTAQRLNQVQALARSVVDLARAEWSRDWSLALEQDSEGEVRLRVGPEGEFLTSFAPPPGYQVELRVTGDGRVRSEDVVRTVRVVVTDFQGQSYEFATRVARPAD